MKLYAVIALSMIVPISGCYDNVKQGATNSKLTAQPGDPGFPYFYCDTIIESEDVFGPIKENQKTYSGNLHFELFSSRKWISFAVDFYQNEVKYQLFYQDFYDVEEGIINIDYTLTFPENFVVKEPGIIKFYCDNRGGEYAALGRYQLKTLPPTIKIEDYLDHDFIAEGYCFQLGKVENFTDKYHFEFPRGGYFLNDRYYRLNLDFLYFRYDGPFLGDSLNKLYVNDVNNLFPCLPSDINGKYLPLDYVKKEDNIYFEFKGPLFVEPNSLIMSFEDKEGFVKSNYFYLPRGKAALFNNYEFTLCLNDVGVSKISFSFDLKFEVGYLLFGDCINSDYCLEGNVYD